MSDGDGIAAASVGDVMRDGNEWTVTWTGIDGATYVERCGERREALYFRRTKTDAMRQRQRLHRTRALVRSTRGQVVDFRVIATRSDGAEVEMRFDKAIVDEEGMQVEFTVDGATYGVWMSRLAECAE